jgi:hypothetical protein
MFLRNRPYVTDIPLLGRRATLPGGLNVAADWWVGLVIFMVVVVPSACFLSTVPLDAALTAFYGEWFARLYAVLVLVMSLASIALLGTTVLCDPGFVFPPRWAARRPDLVAPMGKEFDAAQEVHFCPVCMLFVAGYDHHCGILGACIGRRNMWSFVLFNTAVAILSALSLPGSVAFLAAHLTLPTTVSNVSLVHVLQLFSLGVAKALVAVGGAVHGGGYCTLLSVVYWRHILRGTDSHARRRGASAVQDASVVEVLSSVPATSVQRKDFSVCRGCCVFDRKAVREVLAQARAVELSGTVLQRGIAELSDQA